ncbi:MAG: SH3 domain-containing protein [Anaerolineales bacterium]
MNLSNLRRYATRGVILTALALGILFTGIGAFALFWYLPPAADEAPLAAFTWIPGPTNTPQPPTATSVPTSTTTPTFAPLESGELGIGSYVQITGTGGVGLNVRSQPSLTGEVQFLGYDAEVFEVRDGPVDADGYTWWYLVTPVDEGRAGWAAAAFLSVVANP